MSSASVRISPKPAGTLNSFTSETWVRFPLKRIIQFITSGSRGWAEHYSEDGVLFIRIGNLTRNSLNLDLDDVQRVNVPPGVEGERTKVRAGDLLFSITAYLGSVAVVPPDLEDAYVSQHVSLVRIRTSSVLPNWVGWLALSNYGQEFLTSTGYGGTKVQLGLDDIRSFPLIHPPIEVQKTLDRFLQKETAKIDALVSEQEKLIALLQEKRQAIISHAVTKGLDPKAPMKDSGIEWLGLVPKSWSIKRLKQIAKVRGGLAKGRSFGDSPCIRVPYLRVANVQDGHLDLTEVAEIEIEPHELSRYSLKRGDVLMNEGGDFDKLGRGAVWDGSIDPCLHQNHVFSVRPTGISSEWLATYSASSQAKFYFMTMAKQSTNLASISLSNLEELPVCVPPEKMQLEVLNKLNPERKRLDALERDSLHTVALLKERRAALITAAVTGKIDVRGLA